MAQPTTKPPTLATKTISQPTNVIGEPTIAEPTAGEIEPTIAIETAEARPTLEPEPTSVTSNPTTGPSNGETGFSGSAHDAAAALYNDLRKGDFAAAQNLFQPEYAIGFTPEVLQSLWQGITAAGGDVTIGDATETGDTASVNITWNVGFGVTQDGKVTLVKQGGKWFIQILSTLAERHRASSLHPSRQSHQS